MKTCETCRHWGRDTSQEWEDTRICETIAPKWRDNIHDMNVLRLYTQRPTGIAIVMHKDFGCVLHEEKPA